MRKFKVNAGFQFCLIQKFSPLMKLLVLFRILRRFFYNVHLISSLSSLFPFHKTHQVREKERLKGTGRASPQESLSNFFSLFFDMNWIKNYRTTPLFHFIIALFYDLHHIHLWDSCLNIDICKSGNICFSLYFNTS